VPTEFIACAAVINNVASSVLCILGGLADLQSELGWF